MMPEKYTLELNATFSDIPQIRELVMKKMQNRGFTDNEIYDIQLSAVELMENSVKHGYKFEDGKIIFELEIDNDKAVVTFMDYAAEFNILNYRGPDLTQRMERGLGGLMGIKTIRTVCDNVQYTRENDINKTVLIKKKKGLAVG